MGSEKVRVGVSFIILGNGRSSRGGGISEVIIMIYSI